MSATKSKTAAASSGSLPESTPDFEQAFAELERIIAQMESGQMPLEASLQAFTRGNELLEFCQKSLADVEQQVKILNERQKLVPLATQTDSQ